MPGRGPLPSGTARRRNEPTIPTTSLPAGGTRKAPPRPPKGYDLGEAGLQWWRWAWKLPQASAWDASAVYFAARRAVLEDELAVLKSVSGRFDVADVLGLDPDEVPPSFADLEDRLRNLVGALKASAGGRTIVMREMRELDNRLGLNPKALAELRWTIVADEPAKAKTPEASGNVRPIRPRPSAPGAAAAG